MKSAFLLFALLFPTSFLKAEESTLLSRTRQLTFDGKRSGEGYFNADGTKIIFQSEREPDNPFYQIYLLDLETGDLERVSPGSGKTTCAWIHPSGKKVLYASTHEDPKAVKKQEEEFAMRNSGKERRYSWDYDPSYEIYEFDLTTRQTKNLTGALGYDAEGSYSPDGTRIAFASNRSAHTKPSPLSSEDLTWFKLNPSFAMDLYLMNSDGTGLRQLTTAPGYDGGPFFNADGSEVCWRRFNRKGTQAEIYRMPLETGEEIQLTSLGAMSWAPYFHPSGEYLIFNSNLEGFANFELYLVDSAGIKEPVRVTFTDGFDGLACFHPDGDRLSWTSNRSLGQSQIYLAQWDHQKALALLEASPQRERPSESLSTALSPEAQAALTPSEPKFSPADVQRYVDYLASPALEGRM
ncbi:MAG: peptidase M28, partial [Verrucomicrobiota bacterium]